MDSLSDPALVLREDRFARLRTIDWWDQARLRAARVLVVGAGALGNEVIKNLSLLGVGRLVVADMDVVEESNLSRSVLFRPGDAGQAKAACAVRAARELYPDIDARALVGNVLADVGLGRFRWAEVVVGAVDNREARVFINRACAQVGRPWIDGGIEVLNGVVRGFRPPQTACYECTMGQADWDLLAERRSCSLLARRAVSARGTPTTPTTAAVIGAIQAQEVVKLLHGLDVLAGRGFVFEGLRHTSYVVDYPIGKECPWHQPAPPVIAPAELTSDHPLRAAWDRAERELGGLDAIDFSRELIERLECPTCRRGRAVFCPLEHLRADEAVCETCGAECVPHFLHSVAKGSPLLERTARQIGLPGGDILWARRGEQVEGLQLDGDGEPPARPATGGNGP